MQLVQKRRVTMTSTVYAPRDTTPDDAVHRFVDYTVEAVDYVPVDVLKLYVNDARTLWDRVVVGATHDAGPGGDTYTEE